MTSLSTSARDAGSGSMSRQDATMEEKECKCLRCGRIMSVNDLIPVTVHEDYGDVCCYKCPNCGIVEYDGMEMFEGLHDDE